MSSSMVVAEATGEDAGGLGIGGPFDGTLGVAQSSKPIEQADKALALAPVALAKGVAQVLAARLRAVVRCRRLADGKEEVPEG